MSYEKALTAYLKKCQRDGTIPMQPSEMASYAGNKYVYLRNSKELLAKYNFKKRRFA